MQGLRDEHGSSAPVSEDLRGYDSPVTDAIRAKAEGAGQTAQMGEKNDTRGKKTNQKNTEQKKRSNSRY